MCSTERMEFIAGQETVQEDPGGNAGKAEPQEGRGPCFLKGKVVWILGIPDGAQQTARVLSTILEQSLTQMARDCSEENMMIVRR